MDKRVKSNIFTSSSMLGQRRGFLLAEETLKIIIALISITFLVFFLTSLYFNNVNDKKIKEAQFILKESDNSIENIFGRLKEGQPEDRDLPNPKGWYFLGFGGEKLPNACTGPGCICICKKSFFSGWVSNCNELGVCLNVDQSVEVEKIEIQPGNEYTKIIISKDSGKISISKKP